MHCFKTGGGGKEEKKKYKLVITLFLFLNPSHRVTQDRWEVLSPSHWLIYLFNTSYTLFLTAEASKRHPLQKSHHWEPSSHQTSDRSGWKQPQRRIFFFFFHFSHPFPAGFWNKKKANFIFFFAASAKPKPLCAKFWICQSFLTPQPPPLPARFYFLRNPWPEHRDSQRWRQGLAWGLFICFFSQALVFPNFAPNELFINKTPEVVGVTQSKESLFVLPAQRKAQFASLGP